MEKLLEADLLTADLGVIFKNQNSINNSNINTTENSVGSATQVQTITDWETELKNRIQANNELDLEVRESEYVIESKFFEEYFTAKWNDTSVVKRLLSMGEPLKHAIKVLGFDEETNPILAFLLNSFVVEKLIRSGLLNASTFKAIYNAVAKKLVAHSQFFKLNDYNIIYYSDLYTKPVNEIMEYLTLQNKILRVNTTKYTKSNLILNKKVFLNILEEEPDKVSNRIAKIKAASVEIKHGTEIIANNTTLKLNNIELAKELEKKLRDSRHTETDDQLTNNESESAKNEQLDIEQFIQTLDNSEQKLAAIQYISINVPDMDAKKILENDKLVRNMKKISSTDMLRTILLIGKKMPKNLTNVEANKIVTQLISEL